MKWIIFTIASCLCTTVSLCQKKPPLAYVILQGSVNKFKDLDEARASGSMSFGGRIKQIVGIGGYLEYMKFKGDDAYFMPIAVEIAVFKDSKKPVPYASFRIGGVNYTNNTDIRVGNSSSINVRTNGGLYLSPNIGALLPIKNNFKVYLSAGYFSAQIGTKTTTVTRSGVSVTNINGSLEGFKFSLGLKM